MSRSRYPMCRSSLSAGATTLRGTADGSVRISPIGIRKRRPASAAWGRVQPRLDRRVELRHLGSHRLWLGHVLDLPLTFDGGSLGPAVLGTLLTHGEVVVFVGDLAHLPLHREVRGHRVLFEAVGRELLYGREPLVLVHVVPGQKERLGGCDFENGPVPRSYGHFAALR